MPTPDQELELELQDRGLTAPRLTPDGIAAQIASEDYHVFPGSLHTVCCLTLVNGFTLTGESACVSPANFNEGIGRRVARDNAVKKIWELEGYRLKQTLFEAQEGKSQDG